jgi:hypothetical protein
VLPVEAATRRTGAHEAMDITATMTLSTPELYPHSRLLGRILPSRKTGAYELFKVLRGWCPVGAPLVETLFGVWRVSRPSWTIAKLAIEGRARLRCASIASDNAQGTLRCSRNPSSLGFWDARPFLTTQPAGRPL